jgi:hypothetical protein
MGAFAPRSRPATSSDEDAEHVDADLIIVSHAASVLDKFNQADKVQGVMGDQALLEAMFDFVERAELPPWVTFEVDDDEDEEEEANGKPKEQKVPGQEQEKTLRHAKGDVARTVVSLIDASAPEWVWKRIATWLDMDGRPDLVSCALLGYGNKARSGELSTPVIQN